MEGVHITGPRNSEPLEKRTEKLKKSMKQRGSEFKWIIVCDIEGNWLYDINLYDFAEKIGVTTQEVSKAINKGIPINGYLVDYDFV